MIRVFAPTTLIYEGYCTLCKESFGVSGFDNRNDVNAAGACMRMPAGPEEYRGSLGRIRINDLGTVAFGGDSALTLFE